MDNNNKQDIFITVQCTIGKSKKVETFGFNFSDLTHTVGNELYLKLSNLRITLEPGELQKITEQVNFAKPVMEQHFQVLYPGNHQLGTNSEFFTLRKELTILAENGHQIQQIIQSSSNGNSVLVISNKQK